MTKTDVRPSALAGTWYSGTADELKNQVDSYIHAAEILPHEGKIFGLIAPHAGHRFSGAVAGYAYRTVFGASYDTVVVISPYHSAHYQPILTTGHSAYSTPLGEIPVDGDNLLKLEQHLAASSGEKMFMVSHDKEHAVEIELPFLQRALSGTFSLMPLMLATHSQTAALALGHSLADVLKGQNVLLIASTDLSHFYPESTANILDKNMLDAIESFDPDQVIEIQKKGKGQACGIMAVLAVMKAVKELGATEARILNYATSGATSGDYSRVVGYAAGVFLG